MVVHLLSASVGSSQRSFWSQLVRNASSGFRLEAFSSYDLSTKSSAHRQTRQFSLFHFISLLRLYLQKFIGIFALHFQPLLPLFSVDAFGFLLGGALLVVFKVSAASSEVSSIHRSCCWGPLSWTTDRWLCRFNKEISRIIFTGFPSAYKIWKTSLSEHKITFLHGFCLFRKKVYLQKWRWKHFCRIRSDVADI